MSAENYRSATKSHDPGWNDPPKLSYSPGVATGQTTKLNLNKRVAFPVVGTNDVTQPAAAVDTNAGSLPQFIPTASSGPLMPGLSSSVKRKAQPPPPMMMVGTPLVVQIDKSESNSVKHTLSYPEDNEMKSFVKGILENFLLKTDNSRQEEIRKRLDAMQQSWNNGKLDDELTRKLYRLALALHEGRVSEANDCHRSIIVEHGKECVQWAPALRQLIQATAQSTSEASAGDQEAITKPL